MRRFKHIPAWAEERLSAAGREELETWAERILDAGKIEDVFSD
jgi:hypothetical protein